MAMPSPPCSRRASARPLPARRLLLLDRLSRLTSAYAPLSGVIVGEKVWKVIEETSDRLGEKRIFFDPARKIVPASPRHSSSAASSRAPCRKETSSASPRPSVLGRRRLERSSMRRRARSMRWRRATLAPGRRVRRLLGEATMPGDDAKRTSLCGGEVDDRLADALRRPRTLGSGGYCNNLRQGRAKIERGASQARRQSGRLAAGLRSHALAQIGFCLLRHHSRQRHDYLARGGSRVDVAIAGINRHERQDPSVALRIDPGNQAQFLDDIEGLSRRFRRRIASALLTVAYDTVRD